MHKSIISSRFHESLLLLKYIIFSIYSFSQYRPKKYTVSKKNNLFLTGKDIKIIFLINWLKVNLGQESTHNNVATIVNGVKNGRHTLIIRKENNTRLEVFRMIMINFPNSFSSARNNKYYKDK